MKEPVVPLGKFVTGMLWGAVVSLLLAAWLAWAFGGHAIVTLLGLTACATSAAAAVAHIRGYAVRICALVRAFGEAEGRRKERIRSLRD